MKLNDRLKKFSITSDDLNKLLDSGEIIEKFDQKELNEIYDMIDLDSKSEIIENIRKIISKVINYPESSKKLAITNINKELLDLELDTSFEKINMSNNTYLENIHIDDLDNILDILEY